MREIKFQGMAFTEQGRSCIEKWVNGNLIVADNRDAFIVRWESHKGVGYITTIWQVRPDSVGEFTGLKDRNGKEVYEGDMIAVVTSVGNGWAESPTFHDNDYVVEFSNGKFHFGGYTFDNSFVEEIEVIGNVFENGGLLSDSQTTKAD